MSCHLLNILLNENVQVILSIYRGNWPCSELSMRIVVTYRGETIAEWFDHQSKTSLFEASVIKKSQKSVMLLGAPQANSNN
jgi:hypothetical protein